MYKIRNLKRNQIDNFFLIFYKSFIKVLLDKLVAFIMLVTLLPFFVLLGILLALIHKESPFFIQERIGFGGEVFQIYKFKTIKSHKINGLGRLLRRTAIDELLQLVNILKGEMSFVGPRPLLKDYLPYYTSAENMRHQVQPGITGLAQVNGRNSLEWQYRMKLDIDYVNNISFGLDLKILITTCYVIFLSDKKPFVKERFDEFAKRR